MILRIIPSNGGNDNVIGLERGIHYKPTTSRAAALAIPLDLCLPLGQLPREKGKRHSWAGDIHSPLRQEKFLNFHG
jgi:hypothetical protein